MIETQAEWNDWFLPPRVGATLATTTVDILDNNYVFAVLPAGDLDGATLALKYDDGLGGVAVIQLIYGNAVGEAVVPLFTTYITLVDGQQNAMSLSGVAPTLVLFAESVQNLPCTITYTYVTRDGTTNTLSICGSSPAYQATFDEDATTEDGFALQVCVPGQLAIYMTTDADVYWLALHTFLGTDGQDTIIADESHPLPLNATITVPAGSFYFRLFNGDATTRTFSFLIIYQT